MLRLIAPVLALCAAAPLHADERTVPVTDFDRIVIEGAFDVRLVRGNVTRAVVSGPRRSLDSVSLEMQGRTLRIRRNPNNWGGYPGQAAEPPSITLSGRELRSARVIGAGSLGIDGARGMRLDLIVDGSGRIRANGVVVDQVSAGVRGSGAIAITGTSEVLIADMQGSGSLEADALQAETLTLTAATSGTVSAQARRAATITANGLGAVTVSGAGACTVRGPSAGNVRCQSAR